jgi:hypothetical protein
MIDKEEPYNFWFNKGPGSYNREPRIMHWTFACLGMFIVFIVLTALFVAWPFRQTPRDKIGLSYGGGVVEGAHFQKTVAPGHGLFFNGFGDKLYLYPVTQRNYIISKHPNEGDRKEADFIEAVTSDNVRVEYETSTFFLLNTDLIRQFHERLGLKFHAWGTQGWDQLLDQTLRQVQENSLQRVTRNYDAKDLRSTAGTLEEVQNAVSVEMNKRIIKVLSGNYFCNPDWRSGQHCDDMQFVIKRVTVPNEIAGAYERNAQSLIDVQTAANKVKQAEQQRQEIEKLTEALSKSGGQYPLLKAIESGQVKFWVLPDNKGITLQTPAP